MKIADGGVDYVSAPRDYAELFSRYYTYVVALVRREGIDDNSKEDVASDILLRFYERDFLNVFDASLMFSFAGQPRPARFKSFLSRFVLAYVKGFRDKQSRLNTREVLLCDMPIGVNNATSGSTQGTWVDVFGDPMDDHEGDVLDSLAESALVAGLRAHLVDIPRRSTYDHCDLLALFDAIVEQIRSDGEWNTRALHRRFKISPTAMHTWLWYLRTTLSVALNKPVPLRRPIGPRGEAS